jgi:hypothetical protein
MRLPLIGSDAACSLQLAFPVTLTESKHREAWWLGQAVQHQNAAANIPRASPKTPREHVQQGQVTPSWTYTLL